MTMGRAAFTHGEWTSKVGYVDGGAKIFSSGDDAVIRLWNADGALVREWSEGGFMSACATRIGKWVAGYNGDAGAVRIWNVKTGKLAHRLEGHPSAKKRHGAGGNTSCAAFAPDGVLATGGFDEVVRLWDVKTGALVRTIAVGDLPWSVAFSPDGSSLAVGTLGGVVLLVDGAKGKVRATLKSIKKAAVTAVAFLADDLLVVGGGRGEVGFVHVVRGRPTQLLGAGLVDMPDGGGIEGLAVRDDRKRFAAASRAGWVRAWDIVRGDAKRVKGVDLRSPFFLSVDLGPGKAIVAGGPSPFLQRQR